MGDPRLGRRLVGQGIQYPVQYANGVDFVRQGQSLTRVDLGDGWFYLIPPGKGTAPQHDELAGIVAEWRQTLVDAVGVVADNLPPE